MSFIAGPYILTYGGFSLGVTQNGFELEILSYAERVTGDNLGDSKQDGVYRGIDVFVNTILNEYNAEGADNAFIPYGTLGTVGQVGRFQSDLSAAFVATVVAGTRAAILGVPTSITGNKGILAPNFPIRLLHAARLRNVPLRLELLPYLAGTTYTPYAQSGSESHFTTT